MKDRQLAQRPTSDDYLVALKEAIPLMKNMSEEALTEEVRNIGRYLKSLDDTIATTRSLGAPQILRAGYALHTLKEKVGDRNWNRFVKTHLKGISRASVYRYLFAARVYGNPTRIPDSLTMPELRARIREFRAKNGGATKIENAPVLLVKKLTGIGRSIRELLSGPLPTTADREKLCSEIARCAAGLREFENAVRSMVSDELDGKKTARPLGVAPARLTVPPPPVGH